MILADERARSRAGTGQAAARTSARTSSASSRAMKGLPVTVRLLDPPLHEFLPHDNKTQTELAKRLGVTGSMSTARADAPRGEPDARASRLPAGDHVSRDPRDAGPRDRRGDHRLLRSRRRSRADARDHDPAGRRGSRVAGAAEQVTEETIDRGAQGRRAQGQARHPDRHDDRDPARRALTADELSPSTPTSSASALTTSRS